MFTGFTPGEEVAVTVFSEPVDIAGIVATAGGVVAITFPIGEALFPGTHTVQAIGRQSGLDRAGHVHRRARPGRRLVGVVECPQLDRASPAHRRARRRSRGHRRARPYHRSHRRRLPDRPRRWTPPTPGGNLWWLWVTLALLVVAVGVVAGGATSRRRAQRWNRSGWTASSSSPRWPTASADLGRRHRGAVHLADRAHAATSHTTPASPTVCCPAGEGDGPALYSGQGGDSGPAGEEPPTRWIDPADRGGDPPTTAIRPGAGDTPADPAGAADPAPPPSTQRFDPPADDPTAPRTEQWSPFGNDEPGGEPPPRR